MKIMGPKKGEIENILQKFTSVLKHANTQQTHTEKTQSNRKNELEYKNSNGLKYEE